MVTIMQCDSRTGPNLFLVGAPKCGTTSLYEYLRRHPQVYFPTNEKDYWVTKEPKFFCPDLDIRQKGCVEELDDYLELYRGGREATLRGDASTCYLYSELAAKKIRGFCPNAYILIALRPPVDMMRSYHSDMVRSHWQPVSGFYDALNATYDSNADSFVPVPCKGPSYLDYFGISRFAPQVERYFRVFGRHRVKVVLLEDIVSKPAATFADILAFLEIDTSFQPEFRIFNERPGRSRIEALARFAYTLPFVNKVTSRLVPYSARRRFLSALRRRESGSPGFDRREDRLRALCRPDVESLSALLDRDLSHWL